MAHEHYWEFLKLRGKQVVWRCRHKTCWATRVTYDKRVRPKK